MPDSVLRRMKDFLDEEVKYGGYDLYDMYKEEIDEFYTEASRMINCSPENIAFAYNATDAFASALYSIPFEKGDLIITSDDDYISNHVQFYALYKRFGVHTIRLKNLENGELDLDQLEKLIKEHNPSLVSITHVPTNTGKVQNVYGAGEICSRYGILYIVDACQSIGQMPVDVRKMKCDFLSVTGRKFLRGPRGTGFLFASDRALEMDLIPLRMDGWSARWMNPAKFEVFKSARRYEVYEQSYACTLGLKEALQYANNLGMDNIYAYNQSLLKRLRSNLEKAGDILLMDHAKDLVNIFTFQKPGKSRSRHHEILKEGNVIYSEASRETALIDFDKKGVEWVIRLSPHYFNTIEEIDQVSEIIASI